VETADIKNNSCIIKIIDNGFVNLYADVCWVHKDFCFATHYHKTNSHSFWKSFLRRTFISCL